MWIRKGVKLLKETVGSGDPVEGLEYYIMAVRITLNRGEVIRLPERCLSHQVDKRRRVKDDGFFEHRVRVDRENLVGGVFYAVQGMNVGGYRKVAIAPHLAYGVKGVPGVIPPNAKLVVEIKVLKKM